MSEDCHNSDNVLPNSTSGSRPTFQPGQHDTLENPYRVTRGDMGVGEKVEWLQPVAEDCPLDGHYHEPNQFCRGCAELTGWLPPVPQHEIVNFSVVQPDWKDDWNNLSTKDAEWLTSLGVVIDAAS